MIFPGNGTRPINDKPSVDFPEPDSPTTPKVSALSIENDTLSTARTLPLRVRYSTVSSSMFSNGVAMLICLLAPVLDLRVRLNLHPSD